MRYRKPEELKESGIEWISEIPQEWNLIKLKRIGNFSSGTGFPNKYQGKESGKYPFFKVSDMNLDGNKIFLKSCNNWISVEVRYEIGAKVFPEKTIVFPKIGAALLTNKRRVLSRDSIVDNNVMAFSVRKGIYKYWYYWLLGLDMARIANPSTVPTINESELKELTVSFPSLPEQRSIAAFLDRKTKAIDQLIQKKEQLIDRLKEKRQALITQAVTKGLDPNVQMKDSGIEWLGKMPEHWEITKVKWLVSKIGSGKTPRGGSEVYEEEGIPFLRSQNIHFDGLRLDDVVYINEEIHKDMKSTAIKPNDVLLNITGASIGRASLVPDDFPKANLNQHVCILRPRKENINPDFLHLVVSSNLIQNQIFAFENGTSREGLKFSQVGSLLVSLPSLAEQKEIVKQTREYEESIVALSAGIENQIEKLKEYRQSLISAAVTGKIDVRDEVQKAQTANIYFKRRVLAAKILDDLHTEPTMGRRKLQKILYLLEKEIEAVELKGKYQKDAAGPFDNKMMRSIVSQLVKAEWFKQVERENGYGYKYIPMIKKEEYKEYYDRYWSNINNKIEELIELVRPEKTDLLSLVATLYACWNDFLIKKEKFDGKKLIYESRFNWHEEKKKISNEDWAEALNWMWDNGLKPEGVGKLTREKN